MAQYVVGLDSSLKRIFVWKTTGDPTVLTNWSAQDTGITLNHTIYSVWAVLDGTDIHVAAVFSAHSDVNYLVNYSVFDTTTDTWSVWRETVRPLGDLAPATEQAVSIGVRSDGDVIVMHSRNPGRFYYSRRESGTWTVSDPTGSASDSLVGAIVMGASDRAHFFYFDNTNDDILHRSLSSANALDTQATVDAAVGASVLHPLGRGISYVDGDTNTNIKVPYLDADESITVARIDVSQANPTIATDTAASDNDAEDINSSVVACMAVDGT
jgi:hypothetical protein